MIKTRPVTLAFILLITANLTCSADIGDPRLAFLNKPLPALTLTNVYYFELGNVINTKQLKGKWLILDFWSQYCSNCINSMPKISALREKFQTKVEIIMIGIYGQNRISTFKTTRSLFEKVKKSKNLNLPVAYDDTLHKIMAVNTLPDIIVIDPNGIVRARIQQINELILDKIINGNSTEIQKILDPIDQNAIPSYNANKPFLIDGNGGSSDSYLYRSIISAASKNNVVTRSRITEGKIELLNLALSNIYRYAFFGVLNFTTPEEIESNYAIPIIEASDSSYIYDELGLEKTYNYSLEYQPRKGITQPNPYVISDSWIRHAIQTDLEKAFPYKVSIENRKTACYRLVATKNARNLLKTKNSTYQIEKPNGEYREVIAKNASIRTLIWHMTFTYGFNRHTTPILDDTGIKEKIDFEIHGFTWTERVNSLKKYGLQLVKGEKEVKCLVIKDR